MVQSDILLVLQENPLILWGGIILAAIIFLIARHLENRGQGREVPEPTTLDKIVKPKVKQHLKNRGKEPSKTFFKIGRDHKGLVHKYVDTKLPEKMINPNPEQKSSEDRDAEIDVRIVSVKPEKRLERILQKIIAMFTRREPERKLYVFKEDSFVDTPNSNEMIVDEDVMSYSLAGMEVELSTPTKNTINQAVETAVSEKLLASLPNYTEKVDYLFPLHSQKITEVRESHREEGDW